MEMLCVYDIGAQQGIGIHNVIPLTVPPQHMVDSHSSVVSQQPVGDSHRMVTIASSTTSSSVPMTSVAASTNKTQGMKKLEYVLLLLLLLLCVCVQNVCMYLSVWYMCVVCTCVHVCISIYMFMYTLIN